MVYLVSMLKVSSRWLVIPIVIFFFLCLDVRPISAVCEVPDSKDINVLKKAQEDCQKEIDSRLSAHNKNKEDLASLEKNLATTKKLIQAAQAQINVLEKEIFDSEVKLEFQQELLAAKVRSFYKRSRQHSMFLLILASSSANDLLRELTYRQTMADQDKQQILAISQQLRSLTENKQKLEQNKSWLTKTKTKLDQDTASLKKDVENVEAFFGQVTNKIAELTRKQQELLSARAGTFTSSVGEVPISMIPCSGPPGSPTYCDPGGGTWFAAFSFGAWTHRKGMSQYGAKGRAENGQNYRDILQAYYGRQPVKKDIGSNLAVVGYGSLNFEYYLFGIAEMPSSWPKEALKAQAIAARSFAYRYQQQGKAICTTQACQVFSKSKAESPPGEWRQAVEETRGEVIEDVVTYYSSTSGGYLTTMGWDTTDGQGGSGFASRAWESKAGSPWFYSSWFTQNYTSGSSKCSRSHPWLNTEEMADILNTWLVLGKQGGDERILPVTINQCPVGGVSGNPYSLGELRDKANGLGGAFTSVSSVSVVYANNGETASLNFETNKGSLSISGSEFKRAFNLRAPGYIAIRSPLFNIEKR